MLGHVLWEYCNTSSFGAFTSSARATGDGTDNVAATVAGAISTYLYLQYPRIHIYVFVSTISTQVIWNGLIGVDTFFVVGGCLLSYHTMRELDRTKGGNAGMWIMFYVHRYIRSVELLNL